MSLAIRCKNVTKQYEHFTLDHLNLEIPNGSIVGFVGENGAGKSTTIKAILNLVHPEEGEIQVLGEDSRDLSREVKERIGVVFDGCKFPQGLKCKYVDSIMRGIYSSWNSQVFRDYCRRFGLEGNKTVKELSRGMKMKLSIAAALSHGAELLIMDEATSGLDPMVRDEILDIFLEFIQDEWHTVFLSSHIISDIEKIADYVAFIHKGKLLFMEDKIRLQEEYGLLSCSKQEADGIDPAYVAGRRENAFGCTLLIRNRGDFRRSFHKETDPVSLEEIMLYTVKGGRR